MNTEVLKATAEKLVRPPKGILAIDESVSTCGKRFEKLGVENTEEKRREYRELLVAAPEIEDYISGYILFDETIRQSTTDGKSFASVLRSKGVEVGIKVDQGLKDFPPLEGEQKTVGLEGLADRLIEYKKLGATFAKWRAVYRISGQTPSEALMRENARTLAEYASKCQEQDIVPIVEPEVLIDGSHSLEKCYEVTARNLDILFEEIKSKNIFLPGVLLKTSMVLPGKESAQETHEKIAEMTLKCLQEHVPDDIGGIVFLSGGQSDEDAALNLNAMHQKGDLPWPLSFSYGRAIQNPALLSWAASPMDVPAAQAKLLERARANSLASVGKYKNAN